MQLHCLLAGQDGGLSTSRLGGTDSGLTGLRQRCLLMAGQRMLQTGLRQRLFDAQVNAAMLNALEGAQRTLELHPLADEIQSLLQATRCLPRQFRRQGDTPACQAELQGIERPLAPEQCLFKSTGA